MEKIFYLDNNIFNNIYVTICNSNYDQINSIIINECDEIDLKSIISFLRYNESNLNIDYGASFNPKTNEIRINCRKVK